MLRKFSTMLEVLRERGQQQEYQRAYTFLKDTEAELSSLTYGELDRKARAIAAQLQSMGATGQRALLLYPSGLEFIAAFCGCLYAGVVAVPAYPPRANQKMSRLEAIVADAQAQVILTTEALLPNIKSRVAQNPELAALPCLATDNIDENQAESWQETPLYGSSLAFLQYTSGSTGTPKGVMVSHENLLHNEKIIQQGMQHTEKTILVGWLPLFHDMGLIGNMLQPMYLGIPCILMSPEAFLQRPLRWLQAISRYKATTSGGPNFAYDLCVSKITDEQRATLDLSSWQVAFNGAEPVRAETMARFAAAFASCGFRREAFYPCYGMAETTLIVSGGQVSAQPVLQTVQKQALEQNRVVRAKRLDDDSQTVVGSGQCLQELEIIIAHPQTMERCQPNEVGEIWVCGPSVAQGYWNRQDQTEQTFRAQLRDTGRGPFLRTGDLGFLLNGELFVTGRVKDVIIIRGRNHYPQDIELTVEQSHPALRSNAGAAFSVDLAGEEKLVVAQEVERSYLRKLNANEVIGSIRRAVAEQHDLDIYAVLLLKTVSLPKTSSGKVQRRACRARFLAGTLDVVADWSPNPQYQTNFRHLETEVESLLQQVQTAKLQPDQSRNNHSDEQDKQISQSQEAIEAWLISTISKQVASSEQIDIRQPLVQYGLSSLAAVGISGELQEWLGRELSPTLLYDYPTIESLAQYLGGLETGVNQQDAHPKPNTEEAIAIIGMGCRFPGAKDPQTFWQLLHEGVDAISEVPPSRRDISTFSNKTSPEIEEIHTRWGGFLEQVDQFDPQFFGIAPREADLMDPQQRLLLEVSWEALENAGVTQPQLAGSQTGVFIGISNYDYSRLQFNHPAATDPYSGTGNAFSIAANRLSYVLDLRGPSWAVDTACSSSLVAVHQACQSLQQGECHLALAGGVNLILSPELTITFSKAGMIAVDGRCKTFDAKANGYVRAEGCGVVVLKRISEAQRDGDNILAVIKGSAVNQDGRSNGLTAPNALSQQAVIRQALEDAKVQPAQISYVEAHGTGTSLGDPIEVNSLKDMLMQGRSPDQPCWIGSVKTNIGHLESASGIASLIKVVLSLQHKEIPPHLHLTQINPYISIEGTPFSIPTKLQKWFTGKEPRLAGVSSFGFGGTNAHVVLEEASITAWVKTEIERPKHILTLSAKSELALQELAQRYVETLQGSQLADVCYTANTGRSHFDHRLAVVAESTVQLREKLDAFAAKRETGGLISRQVRSHKPPRLAFLFTGQGSQYVGMGRELYLTQPTFRQTLNLCDEILRPYLEKPLLNVLYPEPGETSPIDATAYTQPTLFALEYALFQLWKSWGIEPEAVLGHSVGEYVASVVAGVFSLEDGLKLIALRGRLMQALPTDGEMVAVLADPSTVGAALEPYGNEVSNAAVNGPRSLVISGKREAIRAISAYLEAQGAKTKALQVSHAFHSPLMEPMVAEFQRVAQGIAYSRPKVKIISNLTGLEVSEEIASAEYWCRHITSPVQFATSMKTLELQGYEVFLEVGPKPILLSMGRQCVSESGQLWLPSMRPGQQDWQQLLESLAQLYVRGVAVDWKAFDAEYPRKWVVLPNYPFQRQRYWIEEPSENGHQYRNQGMASDQNSTLILNLLNQGKTEALVQQLEKVGNLSPSEVELIPKLLKLLVKQHQQELTAASIKDWLYEVEWKTKARFGRPFSRQYLLTPVEVEQQLKPTLTELVTQVDLDSYKEVLTHVEDLSVDYVVQAFREMGWSYKPGERFSIDVAALSLGIVPLQRRLLNRMLQILAEVGIVQETQQQWLVLKTLEEVNPESKSQTLLSEYPKAVAELTLLHRCACKLSGVLRGSVDPLQLIFPQGDSTTVTQLYQESPAALVMNTLVQKAITQATEKLPQSQGIRLLEIGAGTGSTTSYILPNLNSRQTEYMFTDIGALFTTKAQEKFRDYPFVRYQTLDIEVDPVTQGFEEHQYDLIIAANVLHATTSLKQTLSNVRKLLTPGGILVLLEGTARQRWLDLIFGLLEGWWRFNDVELRPDYPLLSGSKWKQLLSEIGFTQVVNLPEINELPEVLSQQAVIIAQADKTTLEQTSLELKSWLILADQQGVAQQLATQLRSTGELCTLVFAGEQYQQIAPEEFTINPDKPNDYSQLLATVITNVPTSIEILHLWSLDTSKVDRLTLETLQEDSKLACGTILHLVQALLNAKFTQQPRLWLITQGAQPVLGINSSMSGLVQSPVWGMGRAISLEHPEIWGGMVDLDPNKSIDESVTTLIPEIWDSNNEDHVAFRHGQRYVARLMRTSHVEKTQSLKFQSDGTYLITGGLGFLGLKLAQWMVEQGARHLVLLGRKGLPQRQEWATVSKNTESGKKIETIQLLENSGSKISIFSADVTDQAQMSSIIEQINTTENPLKGIVHAAGAYSRLLIEEIEPDALESVLRPKTVGTWILHQITKNLDLDFFICFSSAGSVWGSNGQVHYGAANHFLDTFAYYRRSIGLTALSINLGNLGLGGLVSQELYIQLMKQIGLEELQPEQAFNALGWLLETNAVQTVIARVNWRIFKEVYQSKKIRPLLTEIESQSEEVEEESSKQEPEIIKQLEAEPENERYEKLVSYIQGEVAKVLGIQQPQQIERGQSFLDLGMDSLTSVELRNRLQTGLGYSVPFNLAFTYPTVEALVNYLLKEMFSGTSESQTIKADRDNERKPLKEITQLLEDELDVDVSAATLKEVNASASVEDVTNNWIFGHKPNPDAKLRLFCFHYLGGGATIFRQWPDGLRSQIEVFPIQLPGREGRIGEQAFVRMTQLVETLAQVLHPYLDKPFAFYGHSMGALISFELARQIRRQYGLNPVHFFAAASYAPHLINALQTKGESSDLELIQQLPSLIDAPKSLLQNVDFLQALLPTVKADLQLASSYTFFSEAPLDCPISAFAGIQDDIVKFDDVSAWQKHTNSAFDLQIFPGNHLFLLSDREIILQAIRQELA